ncbi:MAG: hypothetical protein RIT40_806 [Planctomycetota bacterium]|jgi:flagellar motor switch protein FliN/FliY
MATAHDKSTELEHAIDAATEAVRITASKLDPLPAGTPGAEALGLDTLMNVPVKVTVEVGKSKIPLGDLVKLAPGSLVTLEREAHEPVDVLVNGKVVARGEVVTIDRRFGVRITSVLPG